MRPVESNRSEATLNSLTELWNHGVLTVPHALAAIAIGILLTTLIAIAISRRMAQRAFEQGLTRDLQVHADERALLTERAELRDREVATLTGQVTALQAELHEQRDRVEETNRALATQQSERAALQARFEQAEIGFREKEALLAKSGEQLKTEFQSLAQQVLEQQGQASQERLSHVLLPFREQMQDFRKRVDEVYTQDVKERATLLAEVRNLQEASERVNQEAENLARALKGDKRLQGNWGELVLERILEESGLRRDHEYFVQATSRSGDGQLKRPDVIIRLPDDKDIVIDAKMSLNAYEEALSTEDEEARAIAIRSHLANVRAHIRRLSEQNYEDLPDLRSLDFVLLFIPIEAAFTLAMEADPKLFTHAFERRIVVVSPTTLMMTLRIIHNVWRYEKQNRHAQEIAQRAGALYDKLRVFVEEMDKLGTQLDTASRTYDTAYNRLASGKGNLVRQAELFRELGARVRKNLPKDLVERALDGETPQSLVEQIERSQDP